MVDFSCQCATIPRILNPSYAFPLPLMTVGCPSHDTTMNGQKEALIRCAAPTYYADQSCAVGPAIRIRRSVLWVCLSPIPLQDLQKGGHSRVAGKHL